MHAILGHWSPAVAHSALSGVYATKSIGQLEGGEEAAQSSYCWESNGGSDGRRSRDLTIFSRALYQLSYRAVRVASYSQRFPPTTQKAPPFEEAFCFATLTGLEPATSAVTGRRANQLRYRA